MNATHKLDVTGLVFALDPPAIVKTGPTTPLVGLNWQQRRHVCEVEWPRVLDVPDPSRVRGKGHFFARYMGHGFVSSSTMNSGVGSCT